MLSEKTRARLKRVAKYGVLSVAAAELVYVASANIILRTSLLRSWLDTDKEALDVEYGSAWSVLPGVVHIRDLTIRGKNDCTEWYLKIDHAETRISLFALTQKAFKASYVDADGVDFRLRLRLFPQEVTPTVVAALPDIAGYANPPMAGAPKPPDGKAPWLVDLENVDVHHAREVWIHTMRYAGDTRVQGRWEMVPNQWTEVGPAHVDIQSLEASYGHAPIGTEIHGQVDLTIDRADISVPDPGPGIFDAMHLRGVLDGDGHTGAGLDALLDASSWRFRSGQGPAHIEARIEGSVFDASRSHVSLAGFEVARKSGAVAHANTLELLTADLTLRRGGPRGGVSVHAPEIALGDVKAWKEYEPEMDKLAFEHGALGASLRLDIDMGARTAEGFVDFGAPALAVKLGERHMVGKLVTHFVAHHAGRVTDLASSKLSFTEAGKGDAWFLNAALDRSTLDLERGPRFGAIFSGHARDASPGGRFIDVVTRVQPGGTAWGGKVDLDGALVAGPGSVALFDAKAKCGLAFARISYSKDASGKIGAGLAGVGPAHVAFDMDGAPVVDAPDMYYARKVAQIRGKAR